MTSGKKKLFFFPSQKPIEHERLNIGLDYKINIGANCCIKIHNSVEFLVQSSKVNHVPAIISLYEKFSLIFQSVVRKYVKKYSKS